MGIAFNVVNSPGILLERKSAMDIAFVGLGQMGRPMAINMLKSGARLTVTSASGKKHAELDSKGARATTDPAEIAKAAIVFLALPGTDEVRETLFGKRGIAPLMKKGQIIVDTSTIDYSATLEMAATLEEKGIGFLDAPVSGMEARAIEGTLTTMCGGKAETLEKVGKIVNSGTGKSYASDFFIPRILKNHFTDGYPLKGAYKDLVSGAVVGAQLGVPMPVLAAATATYQMAMLRGHGQLDKGAMIKVYEELLGVEFRKK